MEKSLTRQTFSVPSQSALEHKFVRLSEAENAYKTKLRELEQQFESKAAALREVLSRSWKSMKWQVLFAIGNNPLHRFRDIASGVPIARVTAVSTCA